jgi:hypothetical protein
MAEIPKWFPRDMEELHRLEPGEASSLNDRTHMGVRRRWRVGAGCNPVACLRGFESLHSHGAVHCPIAGDRRFSCCGEPQQHRSHVHVAQRIERCPPKAEVAGSNPVLDTWTV